MSEAPERGPSRFESMLQGIEAIDLTGLLSLTVAAIAGAVALGRRAVRAVRRRG